MSMRPCGLDWAGLSLIALACAACSSSAAAPPVCDGAPDREACLTDHYLKGAGASAVETCKGGTKLPIEGKKELAFHFSPAMGDAAAQANGRLLERYYEPYDLTFFTREAASMVSFENVLDGDTAEVERQAKIENVPLDSSDPADKARVQKLVGRVLGKNLASFVNQVSEPPQTRLHVVVVSQIISSALAKQLQLGGVVVGLGLSPKLLRDVGAKPDAGNLFEIFSLPDEFTPVLFIGHADLTSLTSGIIGQVTVAHEAGHALGLQHTTDPQNLMYPRADATTYCLPSLSDAQVTSLKEALLLNGPEPRVLADGAEVLAKALHAARAR